MLIGMCDPCLCSSLVLIGRRLQSKHVCSLSITKLLNGCTTKGFCPTSDHIFLPAYSLAFRTASIGRDSPRAPVLAVQGQTAAPDQVRLNEVIYTEEVIDGGWLEAPCFGAVEE